MKWAPEDRLNAYAARLLVAQPDPPRQVGVLDMLRQDVVLLGVLLFPVILTVGGFVLHAPLPFALVGFAGAAVVYAAISLQTGAAMNALQSGVAASAQVTRVTIGYRSARITTFAVDGANGPVESTLVRSSAANVLVEGDVVQVMVDPQTRQVLLVLALLKPSRLYAAPKT
ncbi:MAG TPA: hypothetical protein VFL27_06110 [Candidatus Dormibacteraeota bacterium]|nr:hypothetical protein [Candidatus Dormibacteraeota bacterium]